MISITAGLYRGTRLTECDSRAVRPTAQRMRAALFNILGGGRFDFNISGAYAIDVFAGSGALGLEALSRGAERVLFIEQDRQAVQVITRNIEKLGVHKQACVQHRDARQPACWTGPSAADIIFCDPPYDSALTQPALTSLVTAGAIDRHTLVTVETRKQEPADIGPQFDCLDSRVYGIARLSFYQLAR